MKSSAARWLAGHAIGIVVIFALSHLLGLRADVGIVSLTWEPGSSWLLTAAGGLIYLASWILVTLFAPPLLLAAVALEIVERVRSVRA